MTKVNLEVIPWAAVEARVHELDPVLAGLLSVVSGEIEREGGTSEVFLARYPYGHEIVTDGYFSIPERHQRHEGDDFWRRCFDRVCAPLGEGGEPGLSIPLTIVLQNSVEVVFNVNASRLAPDRKSNRIIPLRILHESEVYGVFEVLDHVHRGDPKPGPWTVVSGCRSAYLMMLRGDRRIRDELSDLLPDAAWDDSRDDSWEILRATARKISPGWSAELLLLPRAWFIGDTAARMRVRGMIGRIAWRQSSYMRKYQIQETEIEHAINRCDPKIDSLQALHHLSHLISIGQGGAVAFRPFLGESEHLGPFAACENFLRGLKIRGLKNLASYPVILVPTYLNQPGSFGYYSLTVPSLFGFVPEKPRNSWVEDYLRPLSSLIKNPEFLKAIPPGPIAWDRVRIYGSLNGASRGGNLRDCRELCDELRDELGLDLNGGPPPRISISPKDRFLVACIKIVRNGRAPSNEIIRPG
jgi:hypothetical protein